jgi:hypothetical protein
MDENQEVQAQASANNPQPEVGFPLNTQQPANKGGNKLPLIILGIVILLAAGGIFFLTRGSSENATPTPTVEGEDSFLTETPVPTETPAPVDKTKIKVEVQNGTGISGEAAYLQGLLRSLGYTNITVGNASSQDNATTTVTFNSSLSSDVVDEITTKLQGIYQEVSTKTSSSITKDVVIVTGLRKGQTPKPSATVKPSVSPTATGSATPSPSPSGQ